MLIHEWNEYMFVVCAFIWPPSLEIPKLRIQWNICKKFPLVKAKVNVIKWSNRNDNLCAIARPHQRRPIMNII